MTAKDLKNALLQEAVQGRLVPQIASEGNARDLLEEIRKEKLSHGLDFANAKSGKRKSKKETALAGSNPCDITEEEIPFDIPENWCWCHLGELGLYRKGPFGSSLTKSMFVPKSNDSIKVYEQKNAIQKDYTLGEYYISKNKFETMQSFIVEPSDIIVSCAGTIGEVYKLPSVAPKGIINQALMRVKLFNDNLSSFWMMYFDYVLKKEASKQGAGTAIKNIPPFEILKAYPFPLPPLAEQKRIVAAIEKFMPLIEEYGKKETQLKAINEKIGTLTKKAILQEAVQGKLVPQIAAEGNAKDFLEEIKKEKEKLIKEGKIKKEKPLPEITEDEIPFDIPESWCWCRLSEYLDIRDGTHDSPKFYDNGIPFVTSKNLNDGILDFSTCKYITEEDHKKFSARSFVEDGDILFAMIGSIGNPVIVKKKFDFSFKNMALFKRYTKEKTDMKYIFYYLSYIQFELKRIATGGVQSFIGLGTFREMLFPLPPLAEQKRIVAAIEKLLPLCEKLGEK